MRLLSCCLLLIALFLSLPAQTKPSSPHAKASRQAQWEKELRDADLAFAKATAERRLEGWMEFFADDAAIIREGKTLAGKNAIRQFYASVFANKAFTLSWTPTKAESSKDGTLGYTYGTYQAANGDRISHGMYLTLWRRVAGKWKVVMDTGSSAALQPH